MKSLKRCLAVWVCSLMWMGCQSGFGPVTGNERGSTPVNASEEKAYKREILKCYKNGGGRVVKIAGRMRCYD